MSPNIALCHCKCRELMTSSRSEEVYALLEPLSSDPKFHHNRLAIHRVAGYLHDSAFQQKYLVKHLSLSKNLPTWRIVPRRIET